MAGKSYLFAGLQPVQAVDDAHEEWLLVGIARADEPDEGAIEMNLGAYAEDDGGGSAGGRSRSPLFVQRQTTGTLKACKANG